MPATLEASDAELIEAVARLPPAATDTTMHRRLQCRKSQKSFRDRKKREHEAIVTTVQTLQDEVSTLQAHIARLVRQVPLVHVLSIQPDFDGGAAVKIARQYTLLFKQGYNSTKRKLSTKQVNFLSAVAVPDIRYNHGVGLQYILNSWLRYTSSFSSVNLEMQDCIVTKTDDGAIVKGVVKSYLKISRSSINTFFPHCPDLLKPRLVGQVLTIFSTMHWCFDENDRLTQLTGNADFTSGLLSILHDIDAVAAVLTDAKFTPPPPNVKKMELTYITEP
ncbi:hypothetical protein ACHHYP_16593 [Achlya hypogyna]|uniref:BZIP domain-containing protein n=1 Tax=Achlya hypogyna TaxID=1202772 RepID=A0A1V9ZE22_ACHHY|nr:hypothetical protein ACHHYP_16593 [Achlya hypogyna]